MEETLALYLARQARSLNLDLPALEEATPEQLRDFARVALQELAALGLGAAEGEVGCWAVPRSPQN
ncbi:hypothetical protein [Deinococcus hopiensis]|uniref:Uncharacterized protein n=1 Tax=Deinococcus hopiensis KR-140 TaxID=695939 RepID=A0A1W1V8R5_9DEIO|nr:hypothetical protein [Deinococcus hopiensis]SMB89636.1 hypothetical protein SAMN00790413_00496 [Deinococcus hopiensis KR-140]